MEPQQFLGLEMKRSSVAGCLVLICLSIFLFAGSAIAQSIYEDYTVTTLAGPDEGGSGWKDGSPTAARFGTPAALAQDAVGNIFVADSLNNTIRKITPNGFVSTVAGSIGVSGTNDGIGNDAKFKSPSGIAVDSGGNLFVADTGNHTIRKITPDGSVTTYAGAPGVSGTANGASSAARFSSPFGVMVDKNDNVYVADTFNDTIRVITPAGVVSTLAGKAGVAGALDKTGTAATFNHPVSLAMDSSGNIYVADTSNDLIRKIAHGAVVTTLAGLAGVSGSANGTNDTARFNTPYGITVDSQDNIYVVDTFNSALRKITLSGVVTTPAGVAGSTGPADGIGDQARFSSPTGVAAGNGLDVVIADFSNANVRKAIGGTNVITLAGLSGAPGIQNGSANTARFNSPAGIAIDAVGNLYVADEQNDAIRKVTPLGDVSTFAGTIGTAGSRDDSSLNAQFNRPLGVAFDPGGNLFVADTRNHTIRKITPGGEVSTFAGLAGVSGTNDGVGTNALFNTPFALAIDAQTNVYVSDTFNHAIRKITPDGMVTTLAGSPGVLGTNNGVGLQAKFAFPEGIVVDPDGNVFVADDDDFTIRKITPDGVVTTFAGVPGSVGSSDGTDAARFNFPFGLAIDSNRNLYLADTANHTLRKITPAGAVTTLAGVAGVTGNVDGTGSDARLSRPAGVAVDANGNVYISDEDYHVIRKASPGAPDMPVVDLITAKVGVTRHFSISNQTTTSWSWSIIRQPAASSAQLSAANSATPTFTPDVEDSYLIRFQGTDNSGHTAIRMLTFEARNGVILIVRLHGGGTVSPNLDGQRLQIGQTYSMTAKAGPSCSFINWTGSTTDTNATLTFVMQTNLTFIANFTDPIAPTLTIKTPQKNSHASNSVFTASGTASDNGQVASVWYQLNGGAWTMATNTTNWTAALNLTQAANTFQAYAVDSLDNVSATNSVTFTWVPSSQMAVVASGQGTVRPNYNGWFLQNGKTYKMVAKPAFNNFFIKWTDGDGNTISTSATLSFLVQSNATFHANFVANPFAPMAGPFAGMFYDTNNIAATNSGYFTISLAAFGSFSAKVRMTSGQKLSFAGKFKTDGIYSSTISAKGSAPLTIQLQLTSADPGLISGSIGGDGWASPLFAVRALYSPANPAPERTNKYTLIIPGGSDSTTQPAGNGFATIKVDQSGNVTLSGVLGDGAKAAQKTFINRPGVWPLFVTPYKGGAIFGWMTFANLSDSDLSGTLYWIKPPQPSSSAYPGGFSFPAGIRAVGSIYSFRNGVPLLNLPAGGVSVLQLGNPVQSFTNHFTLGSDNKIISADGLQVTITTSTGLFKGTATSLGDGTTVPITGILLQKQNAAFGYFLNNSQSGGVYLGQ
jgi:sugar lactone lactonase YvrE